MRARIGGPSPHTPIHTTLDKKYQCVNLSPNFPRMGGDYPHRASRDLCKEEYKMNHRSTLLAGVAAAAFAINYLPDTIMSAGRVADTGKTPVISDTEQKIAHFIEMGLIGGLCFASEVMHHLDHRSVASILDDIKKAGLVHTDDIKNTWGVGAAERFEELISLPAESFAGLVVSADGGEITKAGFTQWIAGIGASINAFVEMVKVENVAELSMLERLVGAGGDDEIRLADGIAEQVADVGDQMAMPGGGVGAGEPSRMSGNDDGLSAETPSAVIAGKALKEQGDVGRQMAMPGGGGQSAAA